MSRDRKENLDISSKAVNGTLLAPGEVFSMNEHVSALDYNEAKVIVDGAGRRVSYELANVHLGVLLKESLYCVDHARLLKEG